MQMLAKGHVQRSAVEWSGSIARYRQSGMGMKAVCEHEGLRLGTLEEWERRERQSETSKGKFVEGKAARVAANPGAVDLPTGVRLRGRG